MVESGQLTEDGKNWLYEVTDPFHDTPLSPSGFPDLNTCNTIVQTFTTTTNVAAPTSVGTSPWDCQVFFNPLTAGTTTQSVGNALNAYTMNSTSGQMSNSSLANTVNIDPGYNIVVGNVGFDWSVPSVLYNKLTPNAAKYPQAAVGGQFRLLSAAVEVVNTTPELYKGGSVTAYRSPSRQEPVGSSVYSNAYATVGYALPVNAYFMPPTTQANAQLYPTSRTWGASEGAYAIATQSKETNDFLTLRPNQPLWMPPPSNAQAIGNQQQTVYTFQPAMDSGQTGSTLTTMQILPFDSHGLIFSGLNAQSTLQVTTRYTIERIPTITEPDLLVLSRPPSPYDPMALELYTRAVQQLPVACMVKENPLGEWFNDVLSTVAEIAPKIGNALGGVGSVLGSGIASGAQMWLDSRKGAPPAKKVTAKKVIKAVAKSQGPMVVRRRQQPPSAMSGKKPRVRRRTPKKGNAYSSYT